MKISFRKYVIFIIVPVIAVAALLYHVASNNVAQYFKHETVLAEFSVNSADSLIKQYLEGLRGNIGHFTDNHQGDLKQLIDQPDNPDLYNSASSLIETYFPGSVTFTIADSQGDVLLKDVETLIGKGCRENIRLFAINNQQSDAQLRVHSDPLNYHFDIMHEMYTSDGRVSIFFVSFEPVYIANFISSLQVPGHQLIVIKKDADSLIEITELGARVKLDRDTHLTSDERERILAVKDVENTLWQIVDILDEDNTRQAMVIIFRDFGIIFASFLLGILLAFVAIMKHEKLRYLAESRVEK